MDVGPNGKPVDHAWEALVRATDANPHLARGKLNAALKGIRLACADDGIPQSAIPDEIERRAHAYRRTFPNCSLTPMALATHWYRVVVPTLSVEERALNRLAHPEHGGIAL